MSTLARKTSPRLWKYLLAALAALIILIPLWTIFVMAEIQPESLTIQEQTMQKRLLWWVAIPVTVVMLLSGGRWLATLHNKPTNAPSTTKSQLERVTGTAGQSKREYVLEVIGLGITLDKYRQGALWETLQTGSPYMSIREQDPKKYPWSEMDKDGAGGGRAMDALENGAKDTPMYWGVPSFYAGIPINDPAKQASEIDPVSGLVGGAATTGMAWHLFSAASWKLAERPDRLIEEVFAFFDAHPDVPYVVLSANDDMGARNRDRPPGTPELLKDGHYIPEMPDASAVFILARRERVDPLRPFVWDDPDNNFVQNELRWMYYNLMTSVPHPERKQVTQTPAQIGADMSHRETNSSVQRQPTSAEWLEAAAAFAQRPDIRGTGIVSTLGHLNPFAHKPPRDWKPTPWFPIPWNRDQLATFDRLPTLGFLHRPTFVKLTDDQGKPLTRRADREQALQAGWQEALATLPQAERTRAPARIIAATNNNTDQLITLHGILNQQAQNGFPEIDTGKSSQFIDTDKRLGNTGAATWFVQMAIGVMGSYRDGGISAAVNLREPDEASIIFISPPPEDKRKSQTHPRGGDIFRHSVTPAIDPANYTGTQ